MDVLNNFWELMTTENEIGNNIISILTVAIEAWLLLRLFTHILNIKYTNNQKLLYILSISLLSLMTKFLIPTPYNVLLNYLVMFIATKFIFKIGFIKTILSILIPITIFALVGNLILNPLLKLFNINSYELNYIPVYKIIYLCLLYFIVYIISVLFQKKNITLNIIQNLDKKSKKLILHNVTLGLFTIIVQLILTYYYINSYSVIYTLFNFISLFAYFFISFYSLTKAMKLQSTQLELENAENYNKTLSILYDNVKAFKHDFDNMVFTIGGFINSNDIIGLKNYYESLEKECQNINNVSLLNPTLINNPGIYNLLTAKYQKAQECNVEIQLEFFFDLNKLHMPIYEFSRMLGIFLDNAIEAASDSNEKIIKIMFRDSSKSCVQIIQIENSYANKSVNTKLIFEKGVTEKENHQGMGLWEVRKILKHNNNINLITENNDEFFKQCLEIYY